MAKKPDIPRNTHTIIEPGEFEKNILRELMKDVRELVSNPAQLSFNIQKFAAEVGLDFFTPLLASPYEGVQQIGQTQRDIAANLGGRLAQNIFLALAAYINEMGMKPIDRKRIIIDYMLTKQDLGDRLSEFEALSEGDKTEIHLDKIQALLRSFVQVAVMTTANGVNVTAALNHPEFETQYEDFLQTGVTPYPVNICPTVIGIAFVHTSLEAAILKQKLSLRGLGGDELDAAMRNVQAQLRAGFSTPNIPEGTLELLRARMRMEELRPGPRGVN
jgi:hypothetical protein